MTDAHESAGWKHLLRVPKEIRTFGEAVYWLRQQRKMTMRALCREIGVSPPFQSDLEHGRRETKRVTDYARALGVEESELESRQGLTEDLTDWLKTRPDLLAVLRDIRGCRCKPLVLKTALRKARTA